MNVEKYINLVKGEYKDKFEDFKNFLLESNKTCNLTSVLDDNGILYKHFLDSIMGESVFPKNASVVEIGSGGGFPSIPIKIIREDLKFTLIESINKKCLYLNKVVDKLKLSNVQVVNLRAEDAGKNMQYREKFDCVCARAVAKLNTLTEYCMPLIKVGGLFIAYKTDDDNEFIESLNAIKFLGGTLDNMFDYDLTGDYGKRRIIVIKKIKNTPIQYPRGQGKERKKPL